MASFLWAGSITTHHVHSELVTFHGVNQPERLTAHFKVESDEEGCASEDKRIKDVPLMEVSPGVYSAEFSAPSECGGYELDRIYGHLSHIRFGLIFGRGVFSIDEYPLSSQGAWIFELSIEQELSLTYLTNRYRDLDEPLRVEMRTYTRGY